MKSAAKWTPAVIICVGLGLLGVIAAVIVISLITLYLAPKGTDLASGNINGGTNSINLAFGSDFSGGSKNSIVNTNALAAQLNQYAGSPSYKLGIKSAYFAPSTGGVSGGTNGRKKRGTGATISCDSEVVGTDQSPQDGDKLVFECFLDNEKTTFCPHGFCTPKQLGVIESKISTKLGSDTHPFHVEFDDGEDIDVGAKFCSFGIVPTAASTATTNISSTTPTTITNTSTTGETSTTTAVSTTTVTTTNTETSTTAASTTNTGTSTAAASTTNAATSTAAASTTNAATSTAAASTTNTAASTAAGTITPAAPVQCSDDDKIRGVSKVKGAARKARDATTPLLYHGGPVMTAPIIYVIWYGDWTGNNGTTLVENFLQGLGTTPWWDLTVQYNNTTPIKYGGSTSDNYSQGKNLTGDNVFAAVQNAINNNAFSSDQNGLYMVLTSADVTEIDFCTKSCGWHTYDSDTDLKYAWIGNAETLCPSSCRVNSVSPNDNPGVDAMVSTIAHEATEAASDPFLNAWYGTDCADENGDKCADSFGTTSTALNGATYNIVVNGVKYLIQENWKLSTQTCAMS